MQETERKLATIRVVEEIKFIEGADKICAYRLGGWWVVDQIDKYTIGSMVVYVEIDSWIPYDIAPFLSKGKEPRDYEGVKGERLRTIKLKGQVSQGLILPSAHAHLFYFTLFEGDDVTKALGIIKWERPINPQLAGLNRGNFPSEIPKTSQERIQNLTKEYSELQQDQWAVTEKLDGTSATFYLDIQGEFHVCSRNLDLKRDENNLYWKMAIDLDIERKMMEMDLKGLALQGEIIGEGIQGNQYKREPVLHLFDVYDVEFGNYLDLTGLHQVAAYLGVKTAPVLDQDFPLENYTIEELLKYAEGESKLNGSQREGLVFQCLNYPEKSFKVISNQWLLKNE
jgi:RNA ligase (TIGR02306 family)